MFLKQLTSLLEYSSINAFSPAFFSSCFEDDEPPCVEEIEFSADCPPLKGTDLDSDVNSNMADVEEEEEDDEAHRGTIRRDSNGQSQLSNMRSCLFPHQTQQVSISERRNSCNGLSISNGQIIS